MLGSYKIKGHVACESNPTIKSGGERLANFQTCFDLRV